MGSVIFLGYNPFEEPMLGYAGRRQLVQDAMKAALFGWDYTRAHSAVLRSSDTFGQSEWQSYGYDSSGNRLYAAETLYAHTKQMSSGSMSGSPFNVQLIPSATVGWIFLGFFIVVVPVNFLVLRLMKRMELAWVTAPILSVVFAGILLSTVRGLYSAKLSRAYNGFVVQDLDSGLSAQWLLASYFMPRGGAYDLTIANTDQIVPADHFESDPYNWRRYSYDSNRESDIQSVDAGFAEVPRMDVPNLAFREVTYHRINTSPLRVQLNLRAVGTAAAPRLQGTVKNDTPYTLYRVAVRVKDRTYMLPDLASGASCSITNATAFAASSSTPISSGRSSGQAVLYALMRDFDPGGPGQLVPSSSKVLLICSQTLEGQAR